MKRNKILILLGVSLLFIIAITVIILNKDRNTLLSKIKSSDNYKIILENCDNTTKEIDKTNLETIEEKLKSISDNGPWLGNTNTCYQKISINYENDNIIQKLEIDVIDTSSIVITESKTSEYYTNATEFINYINSLNTK